MQRHHQRWAPSGHEISRRHVRIAITLHFSTLYPKTRPIILIIIVYNNDIDQQEWAEMAASFLFYASLQRCCRCSRWLVTRTWRITTHPCGCRPFIHYYSTTYCSWVQWEWLQGLSVFIVKDWSENMGWLGTARQAARAKAERTETVAKCNKYPQYYYKTTMYSLLIVWNMRATRFIWHYASKIIE